MAANLDPNETEEGLKRRAYSLGMQLMHSGLDEDVIYARLEKQGIPEDMARQVAADIIIAREKSKPNEERPFYKLALIKIGIGILAGLISLAVLPEQVMIPLGLILGGVVYSLLSNNK